MILYNNSRSPSQTKTVQHCSPTTSCLPEITFSQHQDASWYSSRLMPKAIKKLFKLCTEPTVILSDRLRPSTTAEGRLTLATKSSQLPLFSPYIQRRVPLHYSARNYHLFPHINYFFPLHFKTEIISREITCFGGIQKNQCIAISQVFCSPK